MPDRTFERFAARKLYEKFSKKWRDDLRTAGLYGKPGSPKRPSFAQWSAMHQRNLEMMKESTPADVVEYMGDDPWAEGPAAAFARAVSETEPEVERGVVEIPIAGEDIE